MSSAPATKRKPWQGRAPMPTARLWMSCREFARRQDSVLLQKRTHVGLAAAKVHESFQGVATAAARENCIEKAACRFRVEHAVFLERGKSVSGQHLGPFVAVVTGRVAAGEDMPEAVGKPIPVGHRHHGD